VSRDADDDVVLATAATAAATVIVTGPRTRSNQDRALVLCVDEQNQIQALDRTAPLLPMRPGLPARQTHDYVRHGTTTLFAALDVKAGIVIGSCHARHRAQECRQFLHRIEAAMPAVSMSIRSSVTTRRTRRPPSTAGCCDIPDFICTSAHQRAVAQSRRTLVCRTHPQANQTWHAPEYQTLARRHHAIH